ncbi:MAG: hypothetical protein LBL65_05765 [Campylobacteraceae bacterium]|jgi:hypothetical protein|nr:hypothetical protein [Campylobacteraceae bacterium]
MKKNKKQLAILQAKIFSAGRKPYTCGMMREEISELRKTKNRKIPAGATEVDFSKWTKEQTDEFVTNCQKAYKMRYSNGLMMDIGLLLCSAGVFICAIILFIAVINLMS